MSIFQPKGDIHGRNSIGTPSIRGHHRPINHDFGVIDISRFGVLDNVGPDLAACIDTGDIRDFCVCSDQSKRKD